MAYAKFCGTLLKTTAEIKLYTFDFSDDMEVGQTIVGAPVISVTPVAGKPTIGAPTVAGQLVQTLITGGSVGDFYVGCKIVTSVGETLEGYGMLSITAM